GVEDASSVYSSRPPTPVGNTNHLAVDCDSSPVIRPATLPPEPLDNHNHDIVPSLPGNAYKSVFEPRPLGWIGMDDAGSSPFHPDPRVDSLPADWDPPDVICYKANAKGKGDYLVGYVQSVAQKKIRTGEFHYYDGADDESPISKAR